MTTSDLTVLIDESALSNFYTWLLSLADTDDQPGDDEAQRVGGDDDGA